MHRAIVDNKGKGGAGGKTWKDGAEAEPKAKQRTDKQKSCIAPFRFLIDSSKH